MIEVRPCPFCGDTPTVSTVTRKTTRLTATLIQCEGKDCEVRPKLGPFWSSEAHAITLWNRRRRTPERK